jgi:hypothetical protein
LLTTVLRRFSTSWQATLYCGDSFSGPLSDFIQTDPNCVSWVPEHHLTATAGGTVASDVVWDLGGSFGRPVLPVLQLEDDSFAATAYIDQGDALVVFDVGGQIKWMMPGYYPTMATAGGGLIAATATGNYAFDDGGNAAGQIATLPTYAWHGNAYTSTTAGIAQLVMPNVEWATSYTAMYGGNPSANGTAVGVAPPIEGFNVFALQSFGPTCTLPSSLHGTIVALTGPTLTAYNDAGQQIITGQYLNSAACNSFFNEDAYRRPYSVQIMEAAIREQTKKQRRIEYDQSI